MFEKIILNISLVNISSEGMEMDTEACKALNFIDTGKDLIFYTTNMICRYLVLQILYFYFFWSRQPIKSSIIRIFPYVCVFIRLVNVHKDLYLFSSVKSIVLVGIILLSKVLQPSFERILV
jgi:hypothetical protein